MGRITVYALVALVQLGGCAGPRVLTNDVLVSDGAFSDSGERPLTLVAETQEAVAAIQPASEFVLVVDSDEIGLPPVQFPENAGYPEGIAYPVAPALPDALAAPDDEPADEAKPDAPTELAPAEEEAAGGVMKGNTIIEGDAPVPTVEIAPPAPVTVDAPRLGRACGSSCGDCNIGCDPCFGNNRCGGYVGGSLTVLPGLGAALEFGVNFKKTDRVLWSWDFTLMYMDLTDELVGVERETGKINEARVGVRARLNPCCSRWHPTFRAGVGWLQISGAVADLDTADFDSPGDYLGGYLGAGIEYDLNARWSTGPEIAVFGGWNTSNGDFGIAPTVFWHINYKF